MSSIYLRQKHYTARIFHKAPYLHGYLILAEYERNRPVDIWSGTIDHKKRLVLLLNYSIQNHKDDHYYHNEMVLETIEEMLGFIDYTISHIENTFPIPYQYQYKDLLILKKHIHSFMDKYPDHDNSVSELYSNTI